MKPIKPRPAIRFRPVVRRSFYLLVLIGIAVADAQLRPLERFSFVFDAHDTAKSRLEVRTLQRESAIEDRISLYVQEAILGPTSVDFKRLFVRGTKILSVIVRDQRLYLNLSIEAALPADDSPDQRRSLYLLQSGLERNFRSLGEIRIFINGQLPYA